MGLEKRDISYQCGINGFSSGEYLMPVPFKKDDPLLFGFHKKTDGCIAPNQAEGEHAPFFQIQKADIKGVVVTKDKGSDVNIVKVSERDVFSKLGDANLLFNGSGKLSQVNGDWLGSFHAGEKRIPLAMYLD